MGTIHSLCKCKNDKIKEAVLNNIDFKELSKSCKSTDEISKLTKEFKKVYKAPTKDAAQIALNELEEKYPMLLTHGKITKIYFKLGWNYLSIWYNVSRKI